MPATSTSTRRASARGRDFHLLWFGEGVSLVGSTTVVVLLPLLAVFTFHAGAAWTGALTAAAWLPWLVVGLPAGAWIDGWSPRVVMITADVASALALASIPIAAGLGWLTPAQLVAVALVTGTAGVFFRTAYAILVPALVPDAQLDSANGRLFGTEAAAMVVGPGVAGRLSALVGAAAAVGVGVVGMAVSALCLALIRARPPRRPPADPEPLVRRIRAGVAFVAGDRYLRWFTVIGALSNFGLTGFGAVLVVYLRDIGIDESGVGTYYMIGALGGLLGSAVGARLAARFGSGRASTALFLAGSMALLVGLPSARGALWLSLVGYAATGAMVVAGNVIRSSWRQRYVPSHLLGRVLTASSTLNYGTMPLAGVTAGWLGTSLGARTTVLVMAGVHALAGLLVLASPLRRLRELPARDAEAR